MKKLLLGATTLLVVNPLFTSLAIDEFHSYNKPLSPRMASYQEMLAYRRDVETYLNKVDIEIEKLKEKKLRAKRQYNKAAQEFNRDTFFHPESIALYKEYSDKEKMHDAIHIDNDSEKTIIIIKEKSPQNKKEEQKKEPKKSRYDQMWEDMVNRMKF